MGKSTHFFGQPIYGQLIKLLEKSKILQMSRKHGGERYVKSFDGFTHLLTMLYAVIMRFDSLREIETSMTAEVRKLHHIGIFCSVVFVLRIHFRSQYANIKFVCSLTREFSIAFLTTFCYSPCR